MQNKNHFKSLQLKQPFTIPLIVSAVFIALCIYPVLPVIGLYLNGGLLGIIEDFFFDQRKNDDSSMWLSNWIVNGSLSVCFFVLFSVTTRTGLKFLFSTLCILFIFYFIVWYFIDNDEETDYWVTVFIVPALMACISFLIAVVIKYRFKSQ